MSLLSSLVDPCLNGRLFLLSWACLSITGELLECSIGPCVPMLPVWRASPKPQSSGLVWQYLLQFCCSDHFWCLFRTWYWRDVPTSLMMLSSDHTYSCGHNWRRCCLGLYRDLPWMRCLRWISCVLFRVCFLIQVHVQCIRVLCGLHLFLHRSFYYEEKYLLPVLRSNFFWSSSILDILLPLLRS